MDVYFPLGFRLFDWTDEWLHCVSLSLSSVSSFRSLPLLLLFLLPLFWAERGRDGESGGKARGRRRCGAGRPIISID